MPSIEPELWVEHPAEAVAFFTEAFGAATVLLMGEGDDTLARLSVGDARFWVGQSDGDLKRLSPTDLDGRTSRTLLVVDDPSSTVRAAVLAGATETGPVNEEHGWLLGRIIDPSGHEWEIGSPL